MDCGCDRKPFQDLPGNENPQFLVDAKELYEILTKKYPIKNNKNLDNILNALCSCIIILMRYNVDKDNYKYFTQLVWKILQKNI